MADITLTGVYVTDTNATYVSGIAGTTIAAGQLVYFESSSRTYKLANAASSTGTANVVGVALNGAVANQPVKILTKGILINGAATLTAGLTYDLSGVTSGAIAPDADLVAASTWNNTFVGIGLSTTQLLVSPVISNTVNA